VRPDAVLGYHLTTHTCGVARFNEQLAHQLGVPVDLARHGRRYAHPLYSLKMSELGSSLPMKRASFDLFLHDVDDLGRRWARQADHVFVANRALGAQMPSATIAWCPGTLAPWRHEIYKSPYRQVFCCGMAHKWTFSTHRRLNALLASAPARVLVSSALHEDLPLDESLCLLERQIQTCYGARGIFAGLLSDLMTTKAMLESTYVAAFFEHGVRENNTTVLAAMDLGCCVITNLDRESPPEFVHRVTCLDLHQLTDLEGLDAHAIGGAAQRMVRRRYSWAGLIDLLTRDPDLPTVEAAA